jgi:hypothetical protein
MSHPLSLPGIIHTLISIIAVIAAVISLINFGKIDPKSKSGKVYIWFTILSCLSSFLVMKTGHLSSAHGLSVLVLCILPVGLYAKKIHFFGTKADYIQVTLMSATLFFSLIPAIIETSTRVPLSHPIAANDQSPVIKTMLIVLVILYAIGVTYQVKMIRSERLMDHINESFGF